MKTWFIIGVYHIYRLSTKGSTDSEKYQRKSKQGFSEENDKLFLWFLSKGKRFWKLTQNLEVNKFGEFTSSYCDTYTL